VSPHLTSKPLNYMCYSAMSSSPWYNSLATLTDQTLCRVTKFTCWQLMFTYNCYTTRMKNTGILQGQTILNSVRIYFFLNLSEHILEIWRKRTCPIKYGYLNHIVYLVYIVYVKRVVCTNFEFLNTTCKLYWFFRTGFCKFFQHIKWKIHVTIKMNVAHKLISSLHNHNQF